MISIKNLHPFTSAFCFDILPYMSKDNKGNKVNEVLSHRTLVVIKPDALKRGLTGKIIERIETVGLKLVACKMIQPQKQQVLGNYPVDDVVWVNNLGNKSLATFQSLNLDPQKFLGTTDTQKIGRQIVDKIVDHWTSGPVVIMVWQGPHAVEIVRKIRGVTTPLLAEPGSLLGDLSFDSQLVSTSQNRAMRTFVHATGSQEEAQQEIAHWFGKDYKFLDNYQRTDHLAML
jgi:nucleoside-diphosphate kinase